LKRWQRKRNQQRLVERMIAKYGGREAEFICLVPANVNIDCLHNYPAQKMPRNSRTQETVVRLMNAAHPDISGYHQIGDTIYCWIKGIITRNNAGEAVKTKSLKAVRLAQPPAMNGVPDEKVWKKTSVEELDDLNLVATLKEGTTFRVAYDEANIYFALVCKFADIDQAKFVPCGHDGPCWRSECLEIFLDPYGIRAKNYHFIFNPVPDSFYEARVGFIDDYLHPLFGKEDESWNGAWEYVAKVDRENKCWRAVMKVPFTTLGVSAPKPGTKWTMNIGREHYYLNKETGKPDRELSTWSPNPEEGGFGNISKFGMLEFE